jgi:hypothetical protein
MERTMTTTNSSVKLRRLVPLTAIALSIATGFATGLWTAKSFSHPMGAAQPAAAAAPTGAETTAAMWPIVPSPVIGLDQQFLYGTGDGNIGLVSP